MSAAAFAQSDKPVSFGVKGGVNFARMPYSDVDPSASISAGSITSFHAGIFADFRLGALVSIQPALLYTGKGSKHSGQASGGGFTNSFQSKTNIYYMQLPVNVVYHKSLGEHTFFAGGGPFLSYGLSGKETATNTQEFQGESNTSTISNDVKFGNNDSSNYKRWDYGVSALAGFQFSNGIIIDLSYDLGLANVIPDNDYNNLKAKTRVLALSVGFTF